MFKNHQSLTFLRSIKSRVKNFAATHPALKQTAGYSGKVRDRQEFLSAAILLGSIGVSVIILARSAAAQAPAPTTGRPSLAGITFPIPELGNCASESDCRNYCNDSAHIDACVSFAEAHGLMNKDDSDRAKKFSEFLQSGKTPGGCRNEAECQSFCSDMSHIDVCVSFAKKLGIQDDHLAQGEKILAYLKSGGTMPGGCASEDSCEAYCGGADHSDECVAFLENSDMDVPSDAIGPDGKPMTFDELKKVMALMKSGEAPGGCKNRNECQSYCKDSSHLNDCVAFAVKAGFMTQEQADLAEKSGGKGPGDCNSEDSCQAYCNDSAHRQECFNFAKDRGLIPADKLREMQQGIERLRTGLNNAPPEVASCIKSAVGENVLDDILAGKLLPGEDIGDEVKSCFEKFAGGTEREEMEGAIQGRGGEEGRQKMQETWNSFSPAMQDCLKQKLGADTVQRILAGNGTTTDMATVPQAIQACMQSAGVPTAPPPPRPGGASSSNAGPEENPSQIPQGYCASFASAPSCSFVGSPDSQSYKYCKQCFPDK